jgi:hypothetical protein
MKRQIIHLFISLFTLTSTALAGGSQGGGTPPALSELSKEILMSEPGSVALFDNGSGDIGLLLKGDLLPKLTVRKASLQDTPLSYGDLALSDEEFSMIRSQSKPLGAINLTGAHTSYSVEASESLDLIILKDRREAARSGVKAGVQ